VVSDEHCEYCGHLLGEEVGYHQACHRERGLASCGELGYGAFPGGDPRLFTPDLECSTPEEQARWKADCKLAKDQPSAYLYEPGKHSVLKMYGLGTYEYRCNMHTKENL